MALAPTSSSMFGDLRGGEPGQLDAEPVSAGRQVLETVAAVLERDRERLAAGVDLGRGHRGAGQHALRLVDDGALHRGVLLRRERRCGQQQRERDQPTLCDGASEVLLHDLHVATAVPAQADRQSARASRRESARRRRSRALRLARGAARRNGDSTLSTSVVAKNVCVHASRSRWSSAVPSPTHTGPVDTCRRARPQLAGRRAADVTDAIAPARYGDISCGRVRGIADSTRVFTRPPRRTCPCAIAPWRRTAKSCVRKALHRVLRDRRPRAARTGTCLAL